MDAVEHDIYIGYRGTGTAELADRIATVLAGRGFHVHVGHRAGDPADAQVLEAATRADDFVLLLGPGALDPALRDENDLLRVALARAFERDRNVVPVIMKGYVPPEPGTLPPDLAMLERCQAIAYEPSRDSESIARVLHRLTSHATLEDRRGDRQIRGLAWLVAVFVLAVAAVGGYRAWKAWKKPILDERPLPPFTLYWTAFGERLDNGQWGEFAVRDGNRLSAGDRFRLAFVPSGDGHAYAVSRDARGQVTVLFPSQAPGATSRVRAGQLYEVPAGSAWATVGSGGDIEALYLVAGYDPIENLEALVEEHAEETTPQARQGLLEATIAGLLDGRHAAAGPVIRTRSGRPIASIAQPGADVTTASATLDSGARVTHGLAALRGLLSVAVEIHPRR